jgi:hypothetical protein
LSTKRAPDALEELLAGHEAGREAELEPHRVLEGERGAEAELGEGGVQAERRLGLQRLQARAAGLALLPQPQAMSATLPPAKQRSIIPPRGRERRLAVGFGRETAQDEVDLGRGAPLRRAESASSRAGCRSAGIWCVPTPA